MNGLKGFAATSSGSETPVPMDPKEPDRLFSPGLKGAEWNTFSAAGYNKPVSGICYRTKPEGYFGLYIDRPLPVSGMPLGGIDTGALYLEPSGQLGYTSIFNHLTPVGRAAEHSLSGCRLQRPGVDSRNRPDQALCGEQPALV